MDVGENRSARPFMQGVHILGGNSQIDTGASLPLRKCQVTGVRLGAAHEGRAPRVPGPTLGGVFLPGLRGGEFHRVKTLPQSGLGIAEGRNTGLGGHPCSGQNRHPPCRAGEVEDFWGYPIGGRHAPQARS